MPENLILKLDPETISKGHLYRLINAKREHDEVRDAFLLAEDYSEAAITLAFLELDELENIQINALAAAAQSHMDAVIKRPRNAGGKG